MAKWPSGKAEACKAFTPGSNPGFASRNRSGRPSGRPVSFCASCAERAHPSERAISVGSLLRTRNRLGKEKAPATGEWLERMTDGAPWGIRTLDLEIRSLLLYPTELMARVQPIIAKGRCGPRASFDVLVLSDELLIGADAFARVIDFGKQEVVEHFDHEDR